MRFSKPYIHPVFGECHSTNPKSMPRMFDALAAYNSRVAEGIVHTPEYCEKMIRLQVRFDEWKWAEGL